MKEEMDGLCEIRIAKDGTWYYRGAEMYRMDIVHHLYDHLKKDSTGAYYIEMSDNDRCKVDVEDTPFVVRSAERVRLDQKQEETIQIQLSDGSVEKLRPGSLFISSENVLYCKIKENEFKARFSRTSYYQIMKDVEYDEYLGRYFLKINGIEFFIKENENP